MSRFIVLLALLYGTNGCVVRYPESAYAVSAVNPSDTGSAADSSGTVEDTATGGTDTATGGTDTTTGGKDATSPADTGSSNPFGSSAFVSCLQANCPSQLSACAQDSGCVATVTCIVKCTGGDTFCAQNCMGIGGMGAFTSLYACAGPVCQP